MRYKLAFVLAVAGLAALVSAPEASADWQDTHVCDVPSVDFPTIQSAIDQPLCFTVRLGVIEFTEQLTIGRSLTLQGRSFKQGVETFVSRLRPPAVMNAPYALINIVGARTRVKIRHVVIQGYATGDGLIGVRSARDTRLTIRDCVFRYMRPPTLDARPGFVAIHVGGPLLPGTPTGITGHSITACRFEGYQNAGIVVEGAGTTATIADNIIRAHVETGEVRAAGAAAPTGVLVLDGARATIDRNDLEDNSRAGGGGAAVIIADGGDGSQVVSYNNIDRNDLGVGVDGTSSVKIYRNALFANDTGISLGETAVSNSNTIQLNRIESGGTGLLLGQSSSNNISSNDVLTNAGDGVVIPATSSKNKLYRNRSQGNGDFGYLDASTGTGGTANTYTSNICAGNNGGGAQSSPLGLCK